HIFVRQLLLRKGVRRGQQLLVALEARQALFALLPGGEAAEPLPVLTPPERKAGLTGAVVQQVAHPALQTPALWIFAPQIQVAGAEGGGSDIAPEVTDSRTVGVCFKTMEAGEQLLDSFPMD